MQLLRDATRGNRSGFTLIEGLVVVFVVSVLFTATILVIRPGTKIKEARDARRKGDISSLYAAISLYATDAQTLNLGASSTLYISIPDPAATSTAGTQCQGVSGLPSLASGWTYHCAASSTVNKVDGTGWVPTDLTQVIGGSPIERLPSDPVNATSSNTYYAYALNSNLGWSVATFMESAKGRAEAAAIKDAGYDPERFEIGTDLTALRDAEGLAGYWPFDEGEGNIAVDYSGRSNNGSVSGASWVDGKMSKSLLFSGGGKVTVPNSSSINNYSGGVTVGLWFKPSTIAAQQAQFGQNGPGYMNFWMNSGTGSTKLRWETNSGNSITSLSSIVANKWYYAVGVYDSSLGSNQAKLYIDGKLDNQATLTFTTSTTADITIGAYSASSFPFNGSIDDVRVYKRALGAGEIQALYDSYK